MLIADIADKRLKAKTIMTEVKDYIIGKKLVASHRKHWDNGSEIWLGSVLVAQSEISFIKKKEQLNERIKSKFPEVSITFGKAESYKGRIEMFLSFYISYIL
jgi:hypothetical protein